MFFSEHEYFKTELAGRVLNELQTSWIIKINIKSDQNTNKVHI